MICCLLLLCYRRLSVGNYHSFTVSQFPTVFSVVCINVCLRGESKEIQKTRDGHQYFICCSKARFWTSFQQLSVRLTTHVHMNAALLGGFLMSPVWVSNLFTLQISEGSHVAVGISSKATDREDICSQTLSLFVFFPHTPCFPHPVFST